MTIRSHLFSNYAGKSPAVGHALAHEPIKWYDDQADNPPWIKALADVGCITDARWRSVTFGCRKSADDCSPRVALGNTRFRRQYDWRRFIVSGGFDSSE